MAGAPARGERFRCSHFDISRRTLGALGAAAFATALACGLSPAHAAPRTDVVIGIQLEPPHLDPTAGAAAAIDEVVYANVFEGLTRFAPDGDDLPAWPRAGRSRPTGSPGPSTCATA